MAKRRAKRTRRTSRTRPALRSIGRNDLPKMRLMLKAPAFRDELPLITAPGLANAAQLSSTSLQIDGIRTVVVTDLTHGRIERGLQKSNRLKDEFLATLSHELGTPLNVILR